MEPFLGSEDLLIDMAELFKVFGDSTRIKSCAACLTARCLCRSWRTG